MMFKIFVLLIVLMLSIAMAQVEITEIMFNPEDSNEWVEFYNSGDLADLSNTEITDNHQKDNIVCCTQNCSFFVLNSSFFIILEKDSTLNLTDKQFFCVDDNTIGNGLGNSGDIIKLAKNNETFVDFTYNYTIGRGLSLALLNETWIEAFPTPGEINKITDVSMPDEESGPELEFLFSSEPIYTLVSYGSLIEIVNKNYPKYSGQINVSVYYNLSYFTENNSMPILTEGIINVSFKHSKKLDIDLLFNSAINYTLCARVYSLGAFVIEEENSSAKCINIFPTNSMSVPCDVSLDTYLEKNIFEKDESIGFDFSLSNNTFDFEIEYWVEDLFGNVAKESHKTDNLNKKHFSPDFDEDDKVYFIKANLTKLSCNNTNKNTSTSLIIVKGTQVAKSNQSMINITDAPYEISFGGAIDIRLEIMKGDTRKTLVEAYLKGDEKISYVTSVKIYDKLKETELSLPIILKDNCDEKYTEGKYMIVVSGLDAEIQKEIIVKKNNRCPSEKQKQPKTGSSGGSAKTPSFMIQEPKEKTYELLSIIRDAMSSEVIATVKVYNNDDKAHSYEIWSYLYIGSKSYSGEREMNKEKLILEPFSDEAIILRNKLADSHPDKLLMKIKILREDRKTPYEITQNITLDATEEIPDISNTDSEIAKKETMEIPGPEFYSKQNDKKDIATGHEIIEEEKQTQDTPSRITGNIIYESNTEKIKGYAIIFIAFAVILGIAAFIKLRPTK